MIIDNSLVAVIRKFIMSVEIINDISERILTAVLRGRRVFEDTVGIRRVILTCGYVDFRKGEMVLL